MQSTYTDNKRALILDGDDGPVTCNVYGRNASTLPRLSQHWKIEYATSALLRMKNLTVCRGKGTSCMYGPCNYYGSLENIHNRRYIFDINHKLPVIYESPNIYNHINTNEQAEYKMLLPRETTINYIHWMSHVLNSSKNSLFPSPGILFMDEQKIILESYDATNVDLSSYKARLVKNDKPFLLVGDGAPAEAYDDLRVIDYVFGHKYTDYQVKAADGIFLEYHNFIQTMTPIDKHCGGFVMLGRLNQLDNMYSITLTAVRIPYGYTLIVSAGCIHGDSTLSGRYMMAMTSDHNSMATANTVFLRNYQNQNVNVSLDVPDRIPFKFNKPNPTKVIFNPLSKAYWKYLTDISSVKNSTRHKK